MRDAFAADTDDDLDLPAVVRRKAPPRPQQKRSARHVPRKAGAVERLLAQALKHPGRVAASVFLTGCAGMIAWNALLLQNVRHPAPLFTQQDPAGEPMSPAPAQVDVAAQPLPPVRPGTEAPEAHAMAAQDHYVPAAPVEAAPAPATAPRPAARSGIGDLIRNNGVPSPAPQRTQQAAVQAPAPAAVPSRSPTVRDPIAEMIRLGGPVPTPPANVGRSDGGDIVLAGQRALARLGYGVKVDGAMGPGTRQAIERFEQDRRLPVTGTLNARTARELSTLSGIAVQ
ncbi:peptidoglycan-binding domain-containing protein [Microvirga guangxiensis]|uniref:peptidoglycan-binding domain-containing protein n=1 Tax=Microvirga guangxiensis TaxID=549386 RepID=UPI0015871606|nr:peptidoglycan-binding domain-containing protein [Microvirga guangxiensis]